jgi:UDP-3-O-[3-hydroxymyristoyl] glucosamine N-acyltransferase
MQINRLLIRKFDHISKRIWLVRSFLFLLFYIYNIYGSAILRLHKKTKQTKIHPTAQIHPSACISPWGVVIDKNVKIGKKTVIKPHTTINSGVIIQDQCVIGDSGYQIYRYKTKRLPIIHTGRVLISDDVYIGPNTCIDRGLFGKNTYIGPRSKIGEQVNIGHNTKIGSESIIGNKVTIGGNTLIGEKVHIGNNSVISNRINISSHSVLKPKTIATRGISE